MGNRRILIVDDEPDILRLAKIYLHSEGFEVDAFTDPVKAIEHFKKNPSFFSLVLTDIRMPSMSGIEFANQLLKIRSDVRVMLMTAYETKSLDLETDLPVINREDILRKPFRLNEISKGVKKQLE